jgi:hypothetical protein
MFWQMLGNIPVQALRSVLDPRAAFAVAAEPLERQQRRAWQAGVNRSVTAMQRVQFF